MRSHADLTPTRTSLHAVAEHVLAAARYRATGRIGLRATPGGFGTPPFPGPAGERVVRVEGVDLVVIDRDDARRRPLTTIGDAADFVGIEPGAPTEVYAPTTTLDPAAPLVLDAGVAQRVAAWFALVDGAVDDLSRELIARDPTPAQLWPEHFDLAVTIDEVNYGGSPGDDDHPMPYLYVGPFAPPPADGGFWNEPFGASIAEDRVPDRGAALAFFRRGHDRLGR